MRRDLARREFLEAAERSKAAKTLEAAEMIARARRRAVLDHHYLTGNEVWDRYLRAVNEIQFADQKQLEELEKLDRATGYEGPETTAQRRYEMALLRERIMAREECLLLPKKLASAGAQENT